MKEVMLKTSRSLQFICLNGPHKFHINHVKCIKLFEFYSFHKSFSIVANTTPISGGFKTVEGRVYANLMFRGGSVCV
jgi:hypothetical protein